jgi:hypothetical protein
VAGARRRQAGTSISPDAVQATHDLRRRAADDTRRRIAPPPGRRSLP